MKKKPGYSRRAFIKGAGITMALPFLDAVGGRKAMAADPAEIAPRFFVAVRAGNGVRQAAGDEDEKWWPMDRGQLSRNSLTRVDGAGEMRAVGELADHADKLLIVEGTKYNYPGNGCGHSGGGNQCLTATPPSDLPEGNRSLATGESIDNLIQRTLCPNDPEPLTLLSGRSSGYLGEVLSYRTPPGGESNGILRAGQRNPWEAYKSLFGDPNGTSDAVLERQVAGQRKSVNDLLRDQLQALRSNPALSRKDLLRLELHQDSIRDLEVGMMDCHLPQQRWAEIEDSDANGLHNDPANTETITRMMMDVIALAFACDLKRAATLQIGNGNDQTIYSINGPDFPFHWISHRIEGDGGSGSAPTIQNAAQLHYQIDRVQLKMFKYLIERLEAYTTPTGTLLDDSVAMWTNDLATGIGHGYKNLPYIIAGNGGGYLRNGQYIDARQTGNKDGDGMVPHNQVFNTILNAVGVGEARDEPVSDFGHKGGNGHNQARGGEIGGMKA
jgi:hypothetical protein